MMRMILQQHKINPLAAAARWMRGAGFALLPMALLLSAFVLSFAVRGEDNADAAVVDDNAAIVISAFGDSLSSGWGLDFPQKDGFAPQLQAQLRAEGVNATVINASEARLFSEGGLSRIDWIIEDNPDMVILQLGANDMLNFSPVGEMRENLDTIITEIKQSGTKILLAGMYADPVRNGAKYAEDYKNAYADLAAKHDILLYPFFLEGVYGDPQQMQPDGNHPNQKGTKTIAQNITPLILQTLTKK